MNPVRPSAPTLPEAAVLGGAVTREMLRDAAGREARGGSAVVRSVLAQSLPSRADLGRAYEAGLPRIDPSLMALCPKAVRLIDPQLLRDERCVPIEIFDDLCIRAVAGGRARGARGAVQAFDGRVPGPG